MYWDGTEEINLSTMTESLNVISSDTTNTVIDDTTGIATTTVITA